MKIALLTSPSEDDKHGIHSVPPLSMACLAATLKVLPGVRAKFIDAYGEDLGVAEACSRALETQPDMVAVSSTSVCFPSGMRLVKEVKKSRPGVTILMGGYHPTFFDGLILKEIPEVDFILRGEADLSLPELCRRLMTLSDVSAVPGLSFRSGGNVVRGEPQQVEDLDSLPFPDRTIFDFKGYFRQFGGFPIPDLPLIATMISSRSCPYHCSFCPKMFPGWRYRSRSAENLFEEIKALCSKGIKTIFFQDENFSHDIGRFRTLCKAIIQSKINVRFFFQGTVHHLPPDVFELMHRAGFDGFFTGIESGSDAQLRRFRKPGTAAQLRRGIQNARKAHLFSIGFFIHGGNGESRQDFSQTLHFIRTARPHVCAGSELWIHPGSVLWRNFKGESDVSDLGETWPRRISDFRGQNSPDEIRSRRKLFDRCAAINWLTPSGIFGLIDLFFHNPTIRRAVFSILKNPRPLFKLLKGAM